MGTQLDMFVEPKQPPPAKKRVKSKSKTLHLRWPSAPRTADAVCEHEGKGRAVGVPPEATTYDTARVTCRSCKALMFDLPQLINLCAARLRAENAKNAR